MIHQFSTSQLLAAAALVYHEDKCHLLATSVLKGLGLEKKCWLLVGACGQVFSGIMTLMMGFVGV